MKRRYAIMWKYCSYSDNFRKAGGNILFCDNKFSHCTFWFFTASFVFLWLIVFKYNGKCSVLFVNNNVIKQADCLIVLFYTIYVRQLRYSFRPNGHFQRSSQLYCWDVQVLPGEYYWIFFNNHYLWQRDVQNGLCIMVHQHIFVFSLVRL